MTKDSSDQSRESKKTACKPKKPTGSIERGTLYHIDDFKGRVGWSRHAMRTARQNGLRIIRTAGRAYVMGDDALAYFAKLQTEESFPKRKAD